MEKNSQPSNFKQKRYLIFLIITFISLLLPFAKLDGKHFFLLSFDKKQLHFFFTVFDMQELYLMPFLLIFMFLGIFFMTTLGGRVWCGWSCPQTIFRTIYRDLIQTYLLKIRKNSKNKQLPETEGQFLKKTVAILIWSTLSLVASANFMWYFIPPEDFFAYILKPQEHIVLVVFLLSIALFLIYDAVLLKEDFCIYVCPYARVQSVLFDNDTLQTIYDTQRGGKIYDEHGVKLWSKPQGNNDECTGCEACVRVCPTHIDIRKGMQLECINCLECADACAPIMAKFNKPSLISWTSTNAVEKGQKTEFVRFRTIAYAIALVCALAMLVVLGSNKEHMLLNINRTTQLYKINKDESVDNIYTFLFQNTDAKKHTYFFEVDNKDIALKQPSAPFSIKSGEKVKKIVVLSSKRALESQEKEIALKITAFATDDKEKIKIQRETTFIYPKKLP
ncbi:MAG: cytochrome c oxidase accessory protein CcoG [Sulfurospirillaceae bacterium]|nr:cytochrome c oxidase accessory protein CcoG [Sulfurospirillaceae bacterium]